MTNLVRVSGYVEPDMARLLDETYQALGMRSRSALISEVLGNAGPVLEVLRDMARELQTSRAGHREGLAAFAAAMRPMVDALQGDLDSVESEDPRTSNTGVRK